MPYKLWPEGVKGHFLVRIPPEGPVDAGDAQSLFSLLADLGGDDLTGGLTELPQGLFWQGE